MTTTHRLVVPDMVARVRKALDGDPRIPEDVRVHVDLGTVTLTGTVRWPDEKSEVEGVVRCIDGVERIVNNITVAYGAKEGRLTTP